MHLLIEVGKVKISKREHNIEHDDRKHDKFIKTGYCTGKNTFSYAYNYLAYTTDDDDDI